MGEVVERFPEDLEAATLYAEALMTLSPWRYWNRSLEAQGRTGEAEEVVARYRQVVAGR
jgi:hypothetical protein